MKDENKILEELQKVQESLKSLALADAPDSYALLMLDIIQRHLEELREKLAKDEKVSDQVPVEDEVREQ